MRIKWIALLALIMPTVVAAQDITQRPVRTEKITGTTTGVGLYEVAPDGTVLIDWRAVEATAEGPTDRTLTPVAQMMLAIRDGKWKPMSR
ncbi:hypothetical protein E0H22_15330 [Rhodopseudomonas boonkerdii]|uniref:hypothetical protein n=1 Tax=Rhodopseudomonas boonkerdii TaxID=475937 RepID=UPI001E377B4A|nr:hypothetical protein [Rhodopseudomonas boonkerdii]UGV26936.1 hypothetical protein E0H22_15330 [Rhodopseudomonas boonkerdii]